MQVIEQQAHLEVGARAELDDGRARPDELGELGRRCACMIASSVRVG